MDVAVSELRAQLSTWLDRVRDGEEIVITERGLPVARLTRVGAPGLLESLVTRGLVARPSGTRRPGAVGRRRPAAKRSLAEVVSEQRR
jgi:prevent-host-death family protein